MNETRFFSPNVIDPKWVNDFSLGVERNYIFDMYGFDLRQ